jgi:hypothetical protein
MVLLFLYKKLFRLTGLFRFRLKLSLRALFTFSRFCTVIQRRSAPIEDGLQRALIIFPCHQSAIGRLKAVYLLLFKSKFLRPSLLTRRLG